MTYATRQNWIDRYGEAELIQLTDRTGAGIVDTAVFDRSAADADALIDGHLAGRYPLPLAGVPLILTGIRCDIQRYLLWDKAANEVVAQRYKDALKLLQAIGSGRLSIGLDAAGNAPAPAAGAEMQSGGHVFGRDDSSFI